MAKTKAITIFYSWQSDSDPICNTYPIRNALRLAAIDLEAGINDVKILTDEATSNTAGSPDIPATIFQKISFCDIFVADVTTINTEFPTLSKKTPNPNVLIELGYAIATLGWERIIMVFNKSIGDFPKDLPFDIDRRRISDYSIIGKDDKTGQGNLKLLLINALRTIIIQDPLKPSEVSGLTLKEKQKRLDIMNLTKILSTIHIPTLDLFIQNAPEMIDSRIFHFWEGFNGVKNSSLFHLYDPEANKLINMVHKYWDKSLSYGHCYHNSGHPHNYIFGAPQDVQAMEDNTQDLKQLAIAVNKLQQYSSALFQFIRSNYIEIDLNNTSQNAIEEYISFNREMTS